MLKGRSVLERPLLFSIGFTPPHGVLSIVRCNAPGICSGPYYNTAVHRFAPNCQAVAGQLLMRWSFKLCDTHAAPAIFCRSGYSTAFSSFNIQSRTPSIPNLARSMSASTELRKSAFWSTVVPYGLAMAVLVFMLKYVEYRYWVRDLRMEVYVGVVAVLFTALGIWVGSKLLEGKKVAAVESTHDVDEEAVRRIGISGRELEVLGLMATGSSNQQIADKLFISLPTVKSHASSLFGKLEVKRRTEAVHKAKSLGIIG